MIFKQYYLKSLGHASYFIGSEETGEALVLDVRRDTDIYFREAEEQRMRIRYAVDTHQHNDYVSGICELPLRGNVQLLAGARAELGYTVKRLEDRERLRIGELELEVMQTPGHTPEHISMLVYDRSRGDEPVMLLSGGALLVGDVGRPDLLGGPEETKMHALQLCASLQERLLALPDHVQVFPTHVSGSLCGGSIGSLLSTTIGYEKKMNLVVRKMASGKAFGEDCMELHNLPGVPPYWRRMRRLNQHGADPLGVPRAVEALPPDEFDHHRRKDVFILDCRSPEAFALHVPGSVNVFIGPDFSTWAGTVLPSDTPYVLILEKEQDLWEACTQLLRIGYDLPQGWLAGGMRAWRMAGKELEYMTQWTIRELKRMLEDEELLVLDVRQPAEWHAGHIRNAIHITGAELPERLHEIPENKPLAVICGSGYRSSAMSSLLQRNGFRDVANVLGGMNGWKNAGYETVK
jgi:hydroxyacylglutathione hydrolase